jgi:diacylglycerol kinase (CTP)
MSLAANDAFSFGLAHNGPRRRSLTRSPSPISSIGLFSNSQPAKGIHNIRRQVIRRLSNLQPVPAEVVGDTHSLDDPRQHQGQDMNNVKQPISSNDISKKSKRRDWEFPRKAMHSSIGMLLTSQGRPLFQRFPIRFPYHLSLSFSWISQNRSPCFVHSACNRHTC